MYEYQEEKPLRDEDTNNRVFCGNISQQPFYNMKGVHFQEFWTSCDALKMSTDKNGPKAVTIIAHDFVWKISKGQITNWIE